VTVRIWFRDSLQSEDVKGDLVGVTTILNVARANGNQYAILDDVNGNGLMVEMRNITKGREVEDEDALVGG